MQSGGEGFGIKSKGKISVMPISPPKDLYNYAAMTATTSSTVLSRM